MELGKVNYIYRLIMTALSFAFFGIGCLIIGLLLSPLLCLVFNKDKRKYIFRRLISFLFKIFTKWLILVGIISLEVDGQELLQESGKIIIANHPSLIDIVLLLGLIKEANCVVKKELSDNFFTKWPLIAANYIINSDASSLLSKSASSLKNEESLVLFPEGTRTRDDFLKFKRGVAYIAIEANVAIRPVIITFSTPMLTKGIKWYVIPKVKPHVNIMVKKDLFSAINKNGSLSARELTKKIELFYKKELNVD